MYFEGPSEVRIAGRLLTRAKAYVGPEPGGSVGAEDIMIIVRGRNGKDDRAFVGKWVAVNQNVTLSHASCFRP